MIYLVSALLAVSVAINVVVFDRWLKLARVVLRLEEAVETSLDGLNDVYGNVGKILQLPLATNDPKVVQIHHELKRAHEHVLRVASRLSAGWSEPTEEAGERRDG